LLEDEYFGDIGDFEGIGDFGDFEGIGDFGDFEGIGDSGLRGDNAFLIATFFVGLPFLPLFAFGILSHLPVKVFLIVPTLHLITHLPVNGFISFPSGQDFKTAALAPFAPLFIINIPSI
jgi:hypothetical protein